MKQILTFKTAAPILALCVTLAGAMVATSPAKAESDPIYTEFLSNVAVQGYDPVAYFKEQAAVKGNDNFSTTYMGAEFHFANAENLKDFKANPPKYAPQYGGYCAWAMAQGSLAKGDAQFWRIVDGKLYLNYNQDVKDRWDENIDGFIASADKVWPDVLKK